MISFLMCLYGSTLVLEKFQSAPRTFFSRKPPITALADDEGQAKRFATTLLDFNSKKKSVGQFYQESGGGFFSQEGFIIFVFATSQDDLNRRSESAIKELIKSYRLVFRRSNLHVAEESKARSQLTEQVDADAGDDKLSKEQLRRKDEQIQVMQTQLIKKDAEIRRLQEIIEKLKAVPTEVSVSRTSRTTVSVAVPTPVVESPIKTSKQVEMNLSGCSRITNYFQDKMSQAQGEETSYIFSVRGEFRLKNQAFDIWGPLAQSKARFWIYFDEKAHKEFKLPPAKSREAESLAKLIAGIWVVNPNEDQDFTSIREYMQSLNSNIPVLLVGKNSACGKL